MDCVGEEVLAFCTTIVPGSLAHIFESLTVSSEYTNKFLT